MKSSTRQAESSFTVSGRPPISEDSIQRRFKIGRSTWNKFEEISRKTGQRPFDFIREFIADACYGKSKKFNQRRIPVDDSTWEEFTKIATEKDKLPMDMITAFIIATCHGIEIPTRTIRRRL